MSDGVLDVPMSTHSSNSPRSTMFPCRRPDGILEEASVTGGIIKQNY